MATKDGTVVPGTGGQAGLREPMPVDTEIGQMMLNDNSRDEDLQEIIDNMKSRGMAFTADGAYVHQRQSNVDTCHLTNDELERYNIGPGWSYVWIHTEEWDKQRGISPTELERVLTKGIGKAVINPRTKRPVTNRHKLLIKYPRVVEEARDRDSMARKRRLFSDSYDTVNRPDDAANPKRETTEEARSRMKSAEHDAILSQQSSTKGLSIESGLNVLCEKAGLPRTAAGRQKAIELYQQRALKREFPGIAFPQDGDRQKDDKRVQVHDMGRR